MKAFSLTQVWAQLAVLGLKKWETRSWSARFTGDCYIHAAKNFPGWAKDYLLMPDFRDALEPFGYRTPNDFPTGAVIGKVTFVRCIRTSTAANFLSKTEIAFGDYSPGRFAFEMQNPVVFEEPIPCRGALSFWNVPLEIEEKIVFQELLAQQKKGASQ